MPNIPDSAPAIVTTEYGGVENLKYQDIPVPQPEAGEVLIRIRAAGINRADAAQRLGQYPPPPGASITRCGIPMPVIQPRMPSRISMAFSTGVRRWSVPRTVSPWNR